MSRLRLLLLIPLVAAQDNYGSPQSGILSPRGSGFQSSQSSSGFRPVQSSSNTAPTSFSSVITNSGGFSNPTNIEFSSPRLPSLGTSQTTTASLGTYNSGGGGNSFSSNSNSFVSSGGSSSSNSNSFPSGGNSFSSGGNSFSSGGNSFSSGGNSFSSGGNSVSSGGNSFSSGGNSFSSGGNSNPSSGNSFSSSSSSQGNSVPGGIDFSQATRQADGRLCVIKQESVETVAKDPILSCTHKNLEKCHYTYITYFKTAQEEVCEENFEKKCQITFNQVASKETVRKCYRPQKKECNGQGKEECKTVYESSCTTRYIEKQPGKFVGDTACEKLPVKICGRGCVNTEGPEECHEKQIDSLVDVPEEVCDLNPQKTCRLQTKLVPSLKPKQECTTVPQETCTLNFSQPKRDKKPLRTEWCLDEEGGQQQQTGNLQYNQFIY